MTTQMAFAMILTPVLARTMNAVFATAVAQKKGTIARATCLNDFDGDGVCDEYEVSGCGYEAACNYNPDVTEDDGSCTYPETGLNCEGGCLFDADLPMVFVIRMRSLAAKIQRHAIMTLRPQIQATATIPRLASIVMAPAQVMPTATGCATYSKSPAVPMLRPATTTATRPMRLHAVTPIMVWTAAATAS